MNVHLTLFDFDKFANMIAIIINVHLTSFDFDKFANIERIIIIVLLKFIVLICNFQRLMQSTNRCCLYIHTFVANFFDIEKFTHRKSKMKMNTQ